MPKRKLCVAGDFSVSETERQQPNARDLCRAMFVEGARVLGFSLEARISLKAQEQILEAAQILADELATLLQMQREKRVPYLTRN